MSAFAKYRHAFLIGLQSNIVYRWNFGIRALFSLFHLAFVFILWGAAYAGQTEIGGFDLNQTLTYFIVILVMQFFIGAQNEDYQISEDIRNGLINQFLLKPINYYLYRFSIFVARITRGSIDSKISTITSLKTSKIARAHPHKSASRNSTRNTCCLVGTNNIVRVTRIGNT